MLAAIFGRFAERYDGEVESTPASQPIQKMGIAAGGGSEEINLQFIPSFVKFGSNDGHWRFEANAARTDSVWNAKTEEDGQAALPEVVEQCLAPLLVYPLAGNIQIGRLALIVRRWAAVKDSSSELAGRFCKPELVEEANARAPLRHSHTFRLENLKRYASPLDGKKVNSWVRCHSGVIRGESAVSMEQDINTLSEEAESTAFKSPEIKRFFDWAKGEMDEVVELYFSRKI